MTTPLFDFTPPVPVLTSTPWAKDSATSKEAAMAAKAFASRMGRDIYAYVLGCGARGATMREIEEALFFKRQSICPRVAELKQHKYGLVETTQTRAKCAVYVAWCVELT